MEPMLKPADAPKYSGRKRRKTVLPFRKKESWLRIFRSRISPSLGIRGSGGSSIVGDFGDVGEAGEVGDVGMVGDETV